VGCDHICLVTVVCKCPNKEGNNFENSALCSFETNVVYCDVTERNRVTMSRHIHRGGGARIGGGACTLEGGRVLDLQGA
jgi:hypothetical protein